MAKAKISVWDFTTGLPIKDASVVLTYSNGLFISSGTTDVNGRWSYDMGNELANLKAAAVKSPDYAIAGIQLPDIEDAAVDVSGTILLINTRSSNEE